MMFVFFACCMHNIIHNLNPFYVRMILRVLNQKKSSHYIKEDFLIMNLE